jgi:hypothetical protein
MMARIESSARLFGRDGTRRRRRRRRSGGRGRRALALGRGGGRFGDADHAGFFPAPFRLVGARAFGLHLAQDAVPARIHAGRIGAILVQQFGQIDGVGAVEHRIDIGMRRHFGAFWDVVG